MSKNVLKLILWILLMWNFVLTLYMIGFTNAYIQHDHKPLIEEVMYL